MNIELVEWGGSLSGLIGAALLAANAKISPLGWWFFLASNLLMITFAILGNHTGLLVQQCGFTITSIVGIMRSHRSISTSKQIT